MYIFKKILLDMFLQDIIRYDDLDTNFIKKRILFVEVSCPHFSLVSKSYSTIKKASIPQPYSHLTHHLLAFTR